MPEPKTYVNIILDSSGSMKSMRQEAVDMFNEQVETIRETAEDQEVLVSLTTFSTSPHDPKLWLEPVDQLETLALEDYNPGGGTALFDTVGKTIERLEKVDDIEDEHVAVLTIIVSDGMENQSVEYNQEAIAAAVKEAQDTGYWTFTYLGANQDLAKVSEQLGVPMANTQSFDATPEGMKAGSGATSSGTANYMSQRSGGQTQSKTFYDEDDGEDEA